MRLIYGMSIPRVLLFSFLFFFSVIRCFLVFPSVRTVHPSSSPFWCLPFSNKVLHLINFSFLRRQTCWNCSFCSIVIENGLNIGFYFYFSRMFSNLASLCLSRLSYSYFIFSVICFDLGKIIKQPDVWGAGVTLEDPHTEDLSQEVRGFIFSKILVSFWASHIFLHCNLMSQYFLSLI